MKRTYSMLKILVIFFVLFSAIFTLSACGSKEGYSKKGDIYKNNNPTALVVILGNHANAMAIPKDAYKALEKYVDDAVYGGYVCAIVADATPTKYELLSKDDFFVEDAKNNSVLDKRIEERKKEIMNCFKEMVVPADSPEVDLLGALREAKNVLDNSQFESIEDKRICIIDTGISTTGDLSFTDMDFIYNKPEIEEIIKQLKDYEGVGVLPDLKGIKVTFVGTSEGLAEVAYPQELETTDKQFIKDLWKEIIEECGTKAEFESAAGWDTPNVYTEDENSKFPYVSVITFSHEKVIVMPEISKADPNSPDAAPNLPDPPQIETKLESETIGFKPDSSNYLNEDHAITILRPFAEELKAYLSYYPDDKIWLVGTSAAVEKDSDGSIELSLSRAEEVRKTLVTEFNIPQENLLTIGVAAKFPWFVDEWPNGEFDTGVAQANRAVWVMNESSEQFKKLKSANDKGELLAEVSERFSLFYQ